MRYLTNDLVYSNNINDDDEKKTNETNNVYQSEKNVASQNIKTNISKSKMTTFEYQNLTLKKGSE